MRYQIAVCGSCVLEDEAVAIRADAIGKAIAESGSVLLNGATGGYPQRAALAAQRAGGLCIGISPARNREEHVEQYHETLDGFDVMIMPGNGFNGRNVILVRSADAVIFVGGRMGSVNEFAIAYTEFKVVGVLKGSSRNADALADLATNSNRQGGVVIVEEDPYLLVSKVIAALKERLH